MRHISFALTTQQILARTKTVTRRIGWKDLKVGTLLQAIEKGQGLGKGGKVVRLGAIRVLNVRRERLDDLVDPLRAGYGESEMAHEGFPGMDPQDFMLRFFAAHIDMWEVVTRIEFEYVDASLPQKEGSQ